MAQGRSNKLKSDSGGTTAQSATTGYEAELWGMADTLRGNMDAAEYKPRRPRPDLPQIHLRRLRGDARPP